MDNTINRDSVSGLHNYSEAADEENGEPSAPRSGLYAEPRNKAKNRDSRCGVDQELQRGGAQTRLRDTGRRKDQSRWRQIFGAAISHRPHDGYDQREDNAMNRLCICCLTLIVIVALICATQII